VSLENRDRRGLIAETGGAVLGGLMGLILVGPLGTSGGAVAGAGLAPVLERWVAKMIPELTRRGEVLSVAAATSSGFDAEQVVVRLLDSVEVQPLVIRILDAASRTNSDEILRLLGGVLGASVTDRPRKVDEDLMLVDGIKDLTPGHLRVLEVLEQPADPTASKHVSTLGSVTEAIGSAMSVAAIEAALAGIVARGLAETGTLYGGPIGYSLSEFGKALLDAARRASASGGSPST
jgi:hypothetical protein